MERQEYLRKLRELEKHNHQYYVLSKPLISDRKYDRLLAEVVEYEKLHKLSSKVTKKPGNDKISGFYKSNHRKPMLSLENTYSPQEVKEFLESLPDDTPIYFEDKIDGLALSLTYKGGSLIKAVTRGDGKQGDVVTDNAISVIGIEKFIQPSFTGEIRGEVCIYKEDFEKINRDGEYSNPRNLASGTLKTLHNSELISQRKLRFIAYYCDFENCQNYSHSIKMLRYLRFKLPEQQCLYNNPNILSIDNVTKLLNQLGKSNLKYPTDGVVIKVDDFKMREKLGSGTKYPKWAKAYKYPSEEVSSILNSVEFSVGRTGTVTPIALFNPISIGGTTVSRATLHNKDYIKELNLRYGDTIAIEKGGEIIPKVTKVISSAGGKRVKYPKVCPDCGDQLMNTDGVIIKCMDSFSRCSSQIIEILSHFASRDALNISGLGPKVCEQLYNELGIRSIPELMSVKVEQLLTLEGFQEKSAFKLYKAIQGAWSQPMERWVFGLGIPGIGKVLAETLCKEFITWYKLLKADEHQLMQVALMGDVLSRNFYIWAKNPANRRMVRDLIHQRMPKRYNKKITQSSNQLEGKNIVVTGIFNDYSREFLKNRIETMGGNFHSSIKKDSNILLMGANSGLKKRSQAIERGVKILNVKESLVLLNLE